MSRSGIAALLVVLTSPALARADAGDPRITVGLRLGALLRGGDGYAEHARAFGFPGANAGFDLGLAAGLRVAPRVRLLASAAAALMSIQRRVEPDERLRVSGGAWLLGAGLTPWIHRFDVLGSPWTLAAEVTAAAGLYLVEDELGESAHRSLGPGASAGAELRLGTGAWRMGVRYAYHLTAAAIEDRLGGSVAAGGHELGFELGFGF